MAEVGEFHGEGGVVGDAPCEGRWGRYSETRGRVVG